MKTISTTEARKSLAEIIATVRTQKIPIGIGRRKQTEAIVIPFPDDLASKVSEITKVNANSSSFDFLRDEPDLYSTADLKVRYA